jgi:hypothetical protein
MVTHGPAGLVGPNGPAGRIGWNPAKVGARERSSVRQVLAPAAGAPTGSATTASAARRGVRRISMLFLFSGLSCEYAGRGLEA